MAPPLTRFTARPSNRTFSLLFPATLAVLSAACVGSIAAPDENDSTDDPSNPGSNGSGNGGTGGTGDPTDRPPPPPITTPGVEAVACNDFETGPVFHRLNTTQFQNSVNSLLGTRLPLRADLPEDDLVNGFDNGADVSTSATLVQKYLTAAQKAVDAVLADNALFGAVVPCDPASAGCAKRTLEAFLPKAFRRPVDATEVADYLKFTEVCKSTAKAGIGCALTAALVSPKFLYRAEFLGPEASDPVCRVTQPLTSVTSKDLSPHAFATRLAYFLTSSAPDQQLLDLASQGKLNDPNVIAQQVERMLGADMSGRFARPFIESLPTQWLQVDAVKGAVPSADVFPTWDEPLREAIMAESKLFFAEMVRENRSALDLIRTDFTFLNERLAKHYGIAGVTGTEMRKVDTTGTNRGGVLTQASFLTATSSARNTSIVLRAKWVLNNVLCEHMPEPPEGAADMVPLPPGADGLTNRESLEMRTANAPCISCHKILNPIGFGLETFNAIGAEQRTQNGRTIDPSGEMPGAGSFKNGDEMMAILKKDPRVPMCLTKKLLTYAFGRGLEAKCDDQAIKALGDAFAKDGYKLKNHIVRIAQSELFRTAHRR